MPKIHFIVHTSKTEQLVKEIWQSLMDSMQSSRHTQYSMRVFISNTHKSLESIPCDADIYIGRGHVAEYFRKKHADLIVLSVPFTTPNIIETLIHIKEIPHKKIKAVLISSMRSKCLEEIIKKNLDIELTLYTIPDFDDLNQKDYFTKELVSHFRDKGYNVFLGGFVVEQAAKKMGLHGIYVDFSAEGIESVLKQALNIALIRKLEREKIACFQTLLACENEGVMIVNTANHIIYYNDCASSYLGIPPDILINSPFSCLKDKLPSLSTLTDLENIIRKPIDINGASYLCSKISCFLYAERIGKMITIKKIQDSQKNEINVQTQLYQKGLATRYGFDNIKGISPSLTSVIEQAKTFASVNSNILIVGETGTGKELFAQSIHNISEQKKHPFVAVNCASIPATLIESEFFGYTGGAFTGASKEGKKGYFELAHQGTIFLDEISELPFDMQGRLLRVLSEKQIMRIGDNKIIPINVRVICATNKDLKQMVQDGTFREDLFYRLKVLTLSIPPLREREGDVLFLIDYYINYFSRKLNKPVPAFSDKTKELLLQYRWPGNIRELCNLCEQIVVLGDEIIVEKELFPNSFSALTIAPTPQPLPSKKSSEKEKIQDVLIACKYNKTEAAKMLHINRTTLWKKMKEYTL